MKYAFSTLPCMDFDGQKLIDYCKKYGMSGVEIRMAQDGGICGAKSGAELAALGTLFKNSGVSVIGIGTGVCLNGYDAEKIKDAKNAVDAGRLLNAGGIRLFLGSFDVRNDGQTRKPDRDGIVRALCEICHYAGEFNVLIETHNEYSTGAVLKKLAREVDCENLKFIWDIIHPIEDGESIEDTWKFIGSRVSHLHIKDGKNRNNPVWHDFMYTQIGEGELPIGRIIDLLKSKGFNGALSLEWENLWRQELKAYPDGMDYILEKFKAEVEKAQNNLLKSFDSGCWSTWTPGENQKPQFDLTRDTAKISAAEDSFDYGKWISEANVSGGETNYFEVYYTQKRTDDENMSISAILTWCGSGKTQNIIQRDYADTVEEIGGKKRISAVIKAPENAAVVQVELVLKWQGEVYFSKPVLVKTAPLQKRTVKIAAAHVIPGSSEEENTGKILAALENAAAKNPDLICFAETLFDRDCGLSLKDASDTVPGKYTRLLGERAKKHNTYICFTLHETDGNHFYNTAVLLDRGGRIAGIYRKTHLALIEGERGIVPGNTYPVFQTDFGRVGMLVCWDHYFPETARRLRENGAEIIAVSTAGDAPARSVARAVENGVYFVVAGVGCETGSRLMSSRIIDPCGKVLSKTKTDLDCAFAEIDLNERKYKYWLSVGSAYGEGRVIYMKERRK